jgi:hypothetical protein
MTMPLPSRSLRRALAAAVAGLALTASPSAHAQQPSKADLAKARTLFTEGVALASANNCTAALVKYKEVAQVKLTAKVAFNIAECEERLGQLVSALGNYRLSVAQGNDDKADPKLLREAGTRVEALEARAPRLIITRGKGAEEAMVFVDGTELGSSQLGQPMITDPGPHILIAKVGGKEYLHETVTLAEKEARTFEVKLNVPKTRIEQPPVDQPPVDAPPPPPKSRVPGAVVTAVGGAALITGFAALGLRASALGTLATLCNASNQCPDTDAAHSAQSKGKTMTGLSELMVPVGAIAAGVGIYLLATSGPQKAPAKDEKKEARALTVDVVGWAPGASVGGVSLVGRF